MKKVLAMLLVVLLLATVIPMGAVSVSAEAPTDAGWVWPVDGGLFGRGFENGHSGIDVVAGKGTAVKSVNGGTVMCASKVTTAADGYCSTCRRYGAGYHVTICHPNGLIGMYAHLSDVFVVAGQTVEAGQRVGNVGNTGNSTGDHLHFSFFANNYIADANLVDPLYYLTPFSNVYVTDITETSATIHGILGAFGPTMTQAGIYIGTDPSNMTKISETLNTEGYDGNGNAIQTIFYGTQKWYGTLRKGTTYYYKVWISRFGKEYTSAVRSFTTKGSHTHSWSAWSVIKAATCGADGQQKHTCACGAVETQAIPATGKHTYDNVCDIVCNVCGAERAVDSHTYNSKVTVEVTCGADGVKTYTCSVCGDSYTEVIPATGKHTYDDAYDATCNVCGEEREVPEKPNTPDLPADAPAFVVENGTAREGEEFTIAIRTERNSGIVSFKLKLAYDAAVLELVSVEEKDFVNMSFGPTGNNPFVINWVDALQPNNTTNGVVALVTFRVKEGAPIGKSEITLSYDGDDVYDQSYDNVAFRVENGCVEIVDYIPGDANNDGKVNNKDLGILQQHLNGWSVTVSEKAADANGDGKVNNKDLGILQQYLNGWNVELG